MCIRDSYYQYECTPEQIDLLDSTLKDPEFGEGVAVGLESIRKSRIAWIDDPGLDIVLLRIAKEINVNAGWNLHLRRCDPIQYTEYDEGGKYDWHTDQAPPMQDHRDGVLKVRKISMTLFLNDPSEYEGGEFDVEFLGPDRSKERYETFKMPKGKAVFFQSDQWHRVRPVTSGIRKSLVAWFIGPPYV